MRLASLSRTVIHAIRLAIVCLGLWGGVQVIALELRSGEVVQNATNRYGARGGQLVKQWLDTLDQYQSLSERDKLTRINSFWNQHVRGVENPELWHVPDYWATPVETLGLAAGDCKAYVIGKYVSLRDLGVPAEKLRFVYVKARIGSSVEAHMVLGYYSTPTSIPLVLDNLSGQVQPANERPDLTPVFSFSTEGIYVNGQRAAPIDRIGHWRELLQRMQAEGISLDQ